MDLSDEGLARAGDTYLEGIKVVPIVPRQLPLQALLERVRDAARAKERESPRNITITCPHCGGKLVTAEAQVASSKGGYDAVWPRAVPDSGQLEPERSKPEQTEEDAGGEGKGATRP